MAILYAQLVTFVQLTLHIIHYVFQEKKVISWSNVTAVKQEVQQAVTVVMTELFGGGGAHESLLNIIIQLLKCLINHQNLTSKTQTFEYINLHIFILLLSFRREP